MGQVDIFMAQVDIFMVQVDILTVTWVLFCVACSRARERVNGTAGSQELRETPQQLSETCLVLVGLDLPLWCPTANQVFSTPIFSS